MAKRSGALLNVMTVLAAPVAVAAAPIGAPAGAAAAIGLLPPAVTGTLAAAGAAGIGIAGANAIQSGSGSTSPTPTPTASPTPDDCGCTLYRGVNDIHPGYQNALQGIAIPIGGTATPRQHNEDDTRSIYTSWTTDYYTAMRYATEGGNGGVLLTATVPGTISPSRLVESLDRFEEDEVLVTGTVTGASVRVIPR